MREHLVESMKAAMKAKDSRRLSTIRLINAAIKDRDIAARAEGKEAISEQEILQLLQKMVKQRVESSKLYEEGGRCELADQEREEITIIETFLPKKLSEEETLNAIQTIIKDVQADSIKDMGKVMGALKNQYAGQIDFGSASALIKNALTS